MNIVTTEFEKMFNAETITLIVLDKYSVEQAIILSIFKCFST